MKTYKKTLSIAALFASSIAFAAANYTYNYDEITGEVTVVVTTESGEEKSFSLFL